MFHVFFFVRKMNGIACANLKIIIRMNKGSGPYSPGMISLIW